MLPVNISAHVFGYSPLLCSDSKEKEGMALIPLNGFILPICNVSFSICNSCAISKIGGSWWRALCNCTIHVTEGMMHKTKRGPPLWSFPTPACFSLQSSHCFGEDVKLHETGLTAKQFTVLIAELHNCIGQESLHPPLAQKLLKVALGEGLKSMVKSI